MEQLELGSRTQVQILCRDIVSALQTTRKPGAENLIKDLNTLLAVLDGLNAHHLPASFYTTPLRELQEVQSTVQCQTDKRLGAKFQRLSSHVFGRSPARSFEQCCDIVKRIITSIDTFNSSGGAQATPLPTKSPGKAKTVFLAGLRAFLEKASGVADMIPEPAGTIVKAIADTGVNIMDVLDDVDSNRDQAQNLGGHIGHLIQAVVQYLPKKSESKKTATELMNDLELTTMLTTFSNVLEDVHRGLVDLWAQGRFTQAILRDDNRTALEEYDHNIEQAFRNLQIRLELRMLQSLYGMESANLEQRRRDLLDRLGGSDNGAKEKAADPKELLCLPGTRVVILDMIKTWIRDAKSARMMWLHGVAGCGKTSIAATIAHHQQETFGVSAIFYFTAGNQSRCTSVVRSLSLFLAKASRGSLEAHILEAIKTEQNVADLPLSTQVELLLEKPLDVVPPNAAPVVIVVDALDEWYDKKQVSSLVGLLFRVATETNTRILITSRDEAHIRNAVRATGIGAVRELALDEADHIAVDTDIRSFLEYNFARIRSQRDLSVVDPEWPGEKRLDALVRKSEHLFQFAATALRFIEAGYPPDVLDSVLYSMDSTRTLQDLYLTIFKRVFEDIMDPSSELILRHVLICLVCSSVPISVRVIAYLRNQSANIEQECQRLRQAALNRLGSFLVVPDNADEPIRFLHTSVVDFLKSPSRLQDDPRFFVDVADGHSHLAQECLKLLNRELKQNICGLGDYRCSVDDYKALADVSEALGAGLQYASLHWITHLEAVPPLSTPLELITLVHTFASTHILHWIELLAFLRSVLSVGHPASRKAADWCTRISSTDLSGSISLFRDTTRFIGLFANALSSQPLTLYEYILSFVPTESTLRKRYEPRHTTRVNVIRGPMQKRWLAHKWTADHRHLVLCIALSPDGLTVASGGTERRIRLWDAASGMPKGEPLEGHTDHVRSLVFNRDGKLLVSSSDDKTIRIWDVETGRARGDPLTRHTDSVRSVALSSDGTMVASGSDDGTIRFWGLDSGREMVEPLKLGVGRVHSVAFTPDGSRVVCGCGDGSVRRWNVKTRKAVGEPMTGHTESVRSVCISPNGKMIASGSGDSSVRMWDTETGEQIGAPLEGDTGEINSVAFSPDGETIVSGSVDCTIQLWDARTGKQRGKALTGHTSTIRAAVFTPDGKTVISGSWDGTVRAWDVEGVEDEGEEVEGHSENVVSVGFTSDVRFGATGSLDGSIMLWSAETGTLLGKVQSGYRGGRIQFSADGKALREEPTYGVKVVREWDVSGVVEGTGAEIRQVEPDETLEFPDLGVEVLRIDGEGWIERGGRKWLWVPPAYGWYAHCQLLGAKLILQSHPVPILDDANLL